MAEGIWFLHPMVVRDIDNGRYKLFGMDAPTEVAAAYERLWATRGHGRRAQEDGDLLLGWVVANTLAKGEFDLALRLRDALEKLGWRPTT